MTTLLVWKHYRGTWMCIFSFELALGGGLKAGNKADLSLGGVLGGLVVPAGHVSDQRAEVSDVAVA